MGIIIMSRRGYFRRFRDKSVEVSWIMRFSFQGDFTKGTSWRWLL